MAGNNSERINEFVRNLTGNNEDLDISKLSSAQKARLIAWADTNGVSLNLEDASISQLSTFTTPSITEHKLTTSSELSVGVDIQSRSELFPKNIRDLKSSEEILKIFTLREIAYAENKPDPYQTLTGLFAAKEAIIKANNFSSNNLNEIEIEFNENGKPSSTYSAISISHSHDFAVAMAVSKVSSEKSSSENITTDNKQLASSPNVDYLNRQLNKKAKLVRLLLFIILVMLSIGIGISLGVNFTDIFN